MVGIAERQRVGRMGEGRGVFFSGAELANQRVLFGGNQQLRQVTRGRHVMNRQPGWLNVAGVGHPQRFCLGVHRPDKRVIAARIVVSQARRRAVF